MIMALVVPKDYTLSSLLPTQQSQKSINKGVGIDRKIHHYVKDVKKTIYATQTDRGQCKYSIW